MNSTERKQIRAVLQELTKAERCEALADADLHLGTAKNLLQNLLAPKQGKSK